jgi:hypothetical protein
VHGLAPKKVSEAHRALASAGEMTGRRFTVEGGASNARQGALLGRRREISKLYLPPRDGRVS